MGAAELGPGLGDAGGPLLVAAVATAVTLGAGCATLAVILGSGRAGSLNVPESRADTA
jgi:hypothetical protein